MLCTNITYLFTLNHIYIHIGALIYGSIIVVIDICHTWDSERGGNLLHAVFLTAAFRWEMGGWGLTPTHLWLFLLDKLQHLMSESIILGSRISENIDERPRKGNFQGNFYSSDTHFWTVATTLLRNSEKNPIISLAEKRQLWQIAFEAQEPRKFSSFLFSVRLPLD